MPTYTNNDDSSSHGGAAEYLCSMLVACLFAVFFPATGLAYGEDFARPPVWSDEVKGVFFEDAREALSGEPPTHTDSSEQSRSDVRPEPKEQAIWLELITPATLESQVKRRVLVLSHFLRLMQVLSDSQKVHPNECRREFTLLGTLFRVIGSYPGDVRWKASADQISQMCLNTAESYARATHVSFLQFKDTYFALEDVLAGRTIATDRPPTEPLVPDFAQLMQWMKSIAEDYLPTAIGNQKGFRKDALSISEQAQLLAMLSQVIRREEYGYADDETYQGHADRLRDAGRELNEAAAAENFEKAVQAAAAIQKACADCHADFRG